jgi:chromosomal replication initiation ATPase DnaA
MNQSQIALKVSEYLQMQNEVLHRWKHNDNVYAIYGKWQTDIDYIKLVIESIMNVSLEAKTRKLEIVCARRLFIFFVCYTMKNKTLNGIGKEINLISHATVLHHRNKMMDLVEIGDHYYIGLLKLVCDKLGLTFVKTIEKHDED